MLSREAILSVLLAAGSHAAVLFGFNVRFNDAPAPGVPAEYIEVTLSAAPGPDRAPSLALTTEPPALALEEEIMERPVEPQLPPPEPVVKPEIEETLPLLPETQLANEDSEFAIPMPETAPRPVAEAVLPAEPQLSTAAAALPPAMSTRPVPEASRSSGGAGTYHPTEVHFTRQVRPEYAEARRLGQEGLVVVRAFINIRGRADRVEVAQSSGYPLLDAAACRAAEQSRFRPAYFDKTPVPARVEIPYRFVLTRKDQPSMTASY